MVANPSEGATEDLIEVPQELVALVAMGSAERTEVVFQADDGALVIDADQDVASAATLSLT